VNFEKLGFGRHFRRRPDNGIESFDMSGLQNPTVSLGRSDKRFGLLDRRCHGLLDQNINPIIEQLETDASVIAGWHRQTDSIDFAKELTIIREGKRAGWFGNFGGPIQKYIDNRG
jgi:hypothetical protein